MNAPDARIRVPYPVIVEGRYDKLRLASVIDAKIITTDGFGIFKNEEKKALLRALAARTPVIVLTDPDGAGGVIRSHVCGILPPERTVRLYVPRVSGKEKRKAAPSAEGVLGVEGMDAALLGRLFAPYAAENLSADGSVPGECTVTAADLFRDGLTGGQDSQARRDAVGSAFGLPPGMSAKAFVTALRFVASDAEYARAVAALYENGEN